MGKSRIISLILAFYPARLLFENFPFMSKLLVLDGPNLLLLNKVLIFLLFLVEFAHFTAQQALREQFDSGGRSLELVGGDGDELAFGPGRSFFLSDVAENFDCADDLFPEHDRGHRNGYRKSRFVFPDIIVGGVDGGSLGYGACRERDIYRASLWRDWYSF